ncbi:tetratricopeptide repeat protein [Desulfopila sp. IMCC35006]|uniref:tetratricopeptide repeat protein n=1 Tax=Desulfopila sp. IMCC35006 TaxID=2569542 RepID=UPI0010AC0A99|nr:tetratricopeptide repeat protein [Desulfopila sp. IMCC35006]TKB24287.1 tetratricopeptide repeat protein [Desulfopila sp. IMCC35006]
MKGRGFHCVISTVLTILLLATVVFAGTVEDDLFRRGNEAYSRGDYDQAIANYEQLTTTAGYAPAVLYNLANSYAMAGKTGKAILNYERALRLAPADSDIAGNLELIKKEHGLFPQEPSTAEKFFQLLTLNQWTTLILLALLLITAYLFASMKYRFSRQFSIGARACCLLLLCLGTAGTIFRYQDFNPSVVVAPDVKMLISPFASSASVGTLPEGRLVYPQKSHGSFSYVADEMNRHGWIDSSLIEPICQSARSGS